MKTLLVVEVSPRLEFSVSRSLTARFVEQWKRGNPNGVVVVRDLFKSHIPFVDLHWIGGALTPREQHSPESAAAIKVSDDLVRNKIGGPHSDRHAYVQLLDTSHSEGIHRSNRAFGCDCLNRLRRYALGQESDRHSFDGWRLFTGGPVRFDQHGQQLPTPSVGLHRHLRREYSSCRSDFGRRPRASASRGLCDGARR